MKDDPFTETGGTFMDRIKFQDSIDSKDDDDRRRTYTIANLLYCCVILFQSYCLNDVHSSLYLTIHYDSMCDSLWLSYIDAIDAFVQNQLDIIIYLKLATEL